MVAATPPAVCPSPGGPKIERLHAGSLLWRVHSVARDPLECNPVGAEEKIRLAPAKGAPGRFDSQRGEYAYLYAGGTRKAAIAEAFVRGPAADPRARYVQAGRVRGALLSRLEVVEDLVLVSLHGDGLARVGQDAWLTACDEKDYPLTRAWAGAIRDWAPGAQGFVWRAKRANDAMAYVFFADRGVAGRLAVTRTSRLDEGAGLALVVRLLAQMGVALDPAAVVAP